MQHLVDNWDSASGKVDKKLLHQTIQSFLRTNEEMAQSRNSSGDWEALNNVCEVRVSLYAVMVWMLYLLIALVT